MKLRQRKVADQIRDIIANSLSRGEISDPRLNGVMITRVTVTSDLQLASVYFRFFSTKRFQTTLFKPHIASAE